MKVAHQLPDAVLANPERLVLNVFMMLMGLACLHPDTVFPTVESWSDWYQYEWALGMVLGGGAALHGAITESRPSERLGCSVVAICTLTYAVSVLHVNGSKAFLVFLIFFGVALAKVFRLIRSLAVDATLRAHREVRDR